MYCQDNQLISTLQVQLTNGTDYQMKGTSELTNGHLQNKRFPHNSENRLFFIFF
jgi:hypothetical protein